MILKQSYKIVFQNLSWEHAFVVQTVVFIAQEHFFACESCIVLYAVSALNDAGGPVLEIECMWDLQMDFG